MIRISQLVTIAIFVMTGSLAARADDNTTCFMVNSDDWMNPTKYEAAMQACGRLIASRAGSRKAGAYRGRGYWRHKKGDSEGALADFDQAISIDPRNVEGYSYRGDVLRDIGQLDRALSDYSTAVGIDPTFAAGYYNRGSIFETKGDIEMARREYRRALAAPLGTVNVRLSEWAQSKARARLSAIGP